ncbi:hypothetical protein [Teredinibacter sp. KSP-S5-2]|uniref:hypothetical protein n=1 Tax=Teredinibacter sp. KSP-S5-2 TaxID=3034506 RepID=UPI0029349AA9|nr:hypothetical protein [Teredinibacter sp. KSP-S5-2]WNO09369.1 hypothetical protein P5V12_20720 [Teredinibacter sp. KSP-S5-2]
MIYLMIAIVILLLDAYASYLTLESKALGWMEKSLIMEFVWLIPILGATITLISHNRGDINRLTINHNSN